LIGTTGENKKKVLPIEPATSHDEEEKSPFRNHSRHLGATKSRGKSRGLTGRGSKKKGGKLHLSKTCLMQIRKTKKIGHKDWVVARDDDLIKIGK